MRDSWDGALKERYDERVWNFCIPGKFEMRRDLGWLASQASEAPAELVALACGRTNEALIREAAAKRLGLQDAPAVQSLEMLELAGQMGDTPRRAGQVLRKLRNAAAHCEELLSTQDNPAFIGLMICVLDWYFGLDMDPGAELVGLSEAVSEPIRLIAGDRQTVEDMTERLLARDVYSEALACIAAESLVDHERFELARRLLANAKSLRARQLRALSYSRQGELRKCIDMLEPRSRKGDYRRPDVETLGILGGAYKRTWIEDRQNIASLEKACDLYRRAWEHSDASFYAGINFAATTLWLGDVPAARAIADEVYTLMSSHLPAEDTALKGWSFYLLATRAEAMLLLGRETEAIRFYGALQERQASQPGSWRSALQQLELHLQAFGREPAAQFLLKAMHVSSPETASAPQRPQATSRRPLTSRE